MRTFTSGQHCVILIIVCCLLAFFYFRSFPLHNLPFFSQSPAIEEGKLSSFAVEVVGEVENPGIYCFEDEVDVSEVIKKTGGIKGNVVLTQKHLLTEITNGAKITISSNPSSFSVGMMEPKKRLLYFIPISVNTASLEELVVVPAIGEKTARAVIHHRQEHGKFTSLDELKEVPGIGNHNFKRMEKYLTL